MTKDTEISIERVANGWIIRPTYHYRPEVAVATDTIFIFETFESMVKWLDEHFTKPGESPND